MEKLEFGYCKFNVDGATRGKSGPTGIGEVVHDDRSRLLLAFLESIWVMESNEAELREIRRALQICSRYGNCNLIIEGDSSNAISWAMGKMDPPWKLVHLVRVIRILSRIGGVIFSHTARSSNTVADF